MPTFTYRRISTSKGGGGVATIEAPDRASAIREIIRRGETPTALELARSARAGDVSDASLPVGAGAAESRREVGATNASAETSMALRGLFTRSAMSRAEMSAFIRETSTAIMAGLPLVQGLRTIARQGRNPRQKAMLNHLIEDVERGQSLADAAQSIGPPFNELTINMIRAGEASGRMGEVMGQAAELLDKDLKLRRSVMAATLYPAILTVLIVSAIVVVVTFIVPRVLKSLGGHVVTLPWPTRVVQGLAGMVSGYWWLILLAAAGLAYAWHRIYTTPEHRIKIDRWLLSAPILGRLLRDVAVSRFTRTLGTLTSAGLPVIQALKVTKGTLGNRAMEHVIDEVCEQVAGGKTIADPMEKSGFFPPMLVQIVNLGERSGRLDELLNQAAKAFEERTEMSVKLFTTALPPILVVFLAGAVGFIVLAIMLPMLQMQETLGR